MPRSGKMKTGYRIRFILFVMSICAVVNEKCAYGQILTEKTRLNICGIFPVWYQPVDSGVDLALEDISENANIIPEYNLTLYRYLIDKMVCIISQLLEYYCISLAFYSIVHG